MHFQDKKTKNKKSNLFSFGWNCFALIVDLPRRICLRRLRVVHVAIQIHTLKRLSQNRRTCDRACDGSFRVCVCDRFRRCHAEHSQIKIRSSIRQWERAKKKKRTYNEPKTFRRPNEIHSLNKCADDSQSQRKSSLRTMLHTHTHTAANAVLHIFCNDLLVLSCTLGTLGTLCTSRVHTICSYMWFSSTSHHTNLSKTLKTYNNARLLVVIIVAVVVITS